MAILLKLAMTMTVTLMVCQKELKDLMWEIKINKGDEDCES